MVPSRVTKWMCLPPAVVPCSVVYTACTTVVTIERIVPCAVVAVPIARIIKLSPVAHNIAHIPILVVCVIAFICELHFFISPSQYVYVYRHACKSFHHKAITRSSSELWKAFRMDNKNQDDAEQTARRLRLTCHIRLVCYIHTPIWLHILSH